MNSPFSLRRVRPPPEPAEGIARRTVNALPRAAAFAVVYGFSLAGLAAAGLILREQAAGGRFWSILAAFLAVGLGSGLIAWTAAAAVAGRRAATARFAAMLALLMATTPSLLALAQFVHFTLSEAAYAGGFLHHLEGRVMVSGFVTVAVGLRMILPMGLVLLFAASAVFARAEGRRGG